MAIEKIEDATTLLSQPDASELPLLEQSNPVSPLPSASSTQRMDEFARWARAGELATADAHALLRAHGASIIYGCGDIVCEELPDGTVLTHLAGEIPAIFLADSEMEVSI